MSLNQKGVKLYKYIDERENKCKTMQTDGKKKIITVFGLICIKQMSLHMRKPTILVSDQVRHKMACTSN